MGTVNGILPTGSPRQMLCGVRDGRLSLRVRSPGADAGQEILVAPDVRLAALARVLPAADSRPPEASADTEPDGF